MVSSQGAVTYGLAKELKRTPGPLIGHSTHNIRNTKEFVEQVKTSNLMKWIA